MLRDSGRARDRGRGHAAAGAPAARDRFAARPDQRPERDGCGRGGCSRREHCPAGRTRTSSARCRLPTRTRWAPQMGRSSRSSTTGSRTNIVRQLAARGARVRVLPHTVDAADGARVGRCRPRSLARAGRSGAARRSGAPRAGGDRRRPAAPWHLPRPPDRGPGRRGGDAPPALRPPRREPSGEGPRERPRPGDGPEPRGRGRRRHAAAGQRLHASASAT